MFAGKIGTGLRHGAAAGPARALDALEIAVAAVHERHRAAAAAARTGCGRRSSCRSRSSSGRSTASSGIRGCSASASTRPRATSCGRRRDHASGQGAVSRRRDHEGRARGLLRRDRAGHAAAPGGRPITMERYPGGIGGKGFLAEGRLEGFPGVAERVEVPKKGGVVHYPLATDSRSLLWLANQNTHHAARLAIAGAMLIKPDLCVFDLDPSEDDPEVLRGRRSRCAICSRARPRELGEDLGLEGLPRCRAARRRIADRDVARFAHAVGSGSGRARSART